MKHLTRFQRFQRFQKFQGLGSARVPQSSVRGHHHLVRGFTAGSVPLACAPGRAHNLAQHLGPTPDGDTMLTRAQPVEQRRNRSLSNLDSGK